MKININILSVFFFSITIFFGYMLGNLHVLMSISLILLIIGMFANKKNYIKFYTNDILFLLVIFICFLSITYSKNRYESLIFTFMFTILWIIKVILQGCDSWQIWWNKYIYLFSGVHVLATILMKVKPEFINNINSIILKPETLSNNMQQYANNELAGITGQVGVNSFYISVFIGIVFCKIINNKKNKYYFFFIVSLVAIISTGKRGMFLFSILGISILFFISNKKLDYKIIKKIFYIIILIIFITRIIDFSPIMDKFINLTSEGDITNGRVEYWKLTYINFTESPLLGNGINSIVKIIGDLTHNIYIQLLSDVGIIGFCLFIGIFINNIISSINLFNRLIVKEEKTHILISIYIQIIFLLYGTTGNPLYGNIFLMPYIMSVTVVYSYKKRGNNFEKNGYNYIS